MRGMCAEDFPKRTGHVGLKRTRTGQVFWHRVVAELSKDLPVQTCGQQGATEEIQAEGWRGPPALRRSVGVLRRRAGPGGRAVDGQPWAQHLLVFGLWKRVVLQIIRTC